MGLWQGTDHWPCGDSKVPCGQQRRWRPLLSQALLSLVLWSLVQPPAGVAGTAHEAQRHQRRQGQWQDLLLSPFRARARALQAAEEAAMLAHELRMLTELCVQLLQACRRPARFGLSVQRALG